MDIKRNCSQPSAKGPTEYFTGAVTGPDFRDGATPTLRPAAAGRHNQSLPEWMAVPCGPRAGLERDARTTNTCRLGCLKQRVNAEHR
jgi:hypothetical protein